MENPIAETVRDWAGRTPLGQRMVLRLFDVLLTYDVPRLTRMPAPRHGL